MSTMHSARRSLLFTPGDNQKKIEKAASLDVDSVILDLEDAVALTQKEAARQTVAKALTECDFGRTERLVRVNSSNSPFWQADLAETLPAQPDGYVIPKVGTAEQLQQIEPILANAELAYGRPCGSIRLLVLIESARGVMNLKEIAQASERVDALLFGAEDYVADSGAIRTSDGWELFYARSAVVTTASAFGLQAIDMVYVDFQDLEGLRLESKVARQLGFSGKMAIHPRQVDVINRLFSPSPAEIEHAIRLVQAYEEHAKSGVGVFALDGRMVDRPILFSAQRTLRRATLAGLVDDGDP